MYDQRGSIINYMENTILSSTVYVGYLCQGVLVNFCWGQGPERATSME